MLIHCPSGLEIEAREWGMADMEAMARQAKSSMDESGLAHVVSRAWERTINAGPYPFIQDMDAGVDWKRVLKSDLMWALFRLRAGSFPDDPERGLTGEDYTFDVVCAHHPKPLEFIHSVRFCDLPVRALPDSSRLRMLSGSSFEYRVPDGPLIKYRLPTLDVDAELREYLQQLQKKKKLKQPIAPVVTDYCGAQAVWIEGLKSQEIDKRIAFFADPKLMPLRKFIPTRDAMSAASAHVITKVDATCDDCGRTQEVMLPLGPTFFLPADPMASAPTTDTSSSSSGSASIGTSEEKPSPG